MTMTLDNRPAQDTVTATDTVTDEPTLTVQISNTYTCGQESGGTQHVRYPYPDEDMDDWWENVVQPLTGDGHPCGSSEHALYEATITDAPLAPELVGQEWSGEG